MSLSGWKRRRDADFQARSRSSPASEVSSNTPVLRCALPSCQSLVFDSDRELALHKALHQKRMKHCQVCDFSFVDALDYQQHLAGRHHRAAIIANRRTVVDGSRHVPRRSASIATEDDVIADAVPTAALRTEPVDEHAIDLAATFSGSDSGDDDDVLDIDGGRASDEDEPDPDRPAPVTSAPRHIRILRELYNLAPFPDDDDESLHGIVNQLLELRDDPLFPWTNGEAAHVADLIQAGANQEMVRMVLRHNHELTGGLVPRTLELFEKECIRPMPSLYLPYQLDLNGEYGARSYSTELLFIISRWVSDPGLYAEFVFSPPTEDTGERSEFFTGDFFRRVCGSLPIDSICGERARPIVVGFGSDKTRLSFEGASADPHSVFPANVRQNVFTKQRARDLAQYLPEPNVSSLPAALQPVVRLFFHQRAMVRFFRHVPKWSREGLYLVTPEGPRLFVVLVAPSTGDLPVLHCEASAFAANFAQLARACITCQRPGRELGLLDATYARQDFVDNQSLIRQFIGAVLDDDVAAYRRIGTELHECSLHPIQSALHDVLFYDANTPLFDLDHRMFSGICQVALESIRISINELRPCVKKAVIKRLDNLVSTAARSEHLPGCRPFTNGVSGVGLTQQKIVEAIVKVLPAAINAATELDEIGLDRAAIAEALVLLREYCDAAREQVWIPDSIARFVRLGRRLHNLLPVAFKNVNWATRPKFHGLDGADVGITIAEYGRLDVGSTRPIEEAHRHLCKIPFRFSDHRDVFPQFAEKATLLAIRKWCRPDEFELPSSSATPPALKAPTVGRPERRDVAFGDLLLEPDFQHLRGTLRAVHKFLLGQSQSRLYEDVPVERMALLLIHTYPYGEISFVMMMLWCSSSLLLWWESLLWLDSFVADVVADADDADG
eukprot:TRINITY_DN976_c0_g1_i10.p1 TRINITY_DN976_c0_g1~~TRINITY_DN976_c0_g1_i10.p1  ORF type:complete len:907 (+),score=67.26 TRINITY_DN976_c0_g1_i10:29-2722(+)